MSSGRTWRDAMLAAPSARSSTGSTRSPVRSAGASAGTQRAWHTGPASGSTPVPPAIVDARRLTFMTRSPRGRPERQPSELGRTARRSPVPSRRSGPPSDGRSSWRVRPLREFDLPGPWRRLSRSAPAATARLFRSWGAERARRVGLGVELRSFFPEEFGKPLRASIALRNDVFDGENQRHTPRPDPRRDEAVAWRVLNGAAVLSPMSNAAIAARPACPPA